MEKTYATVLVRTVIETSVVVEFPATDDPEDAYESAIEAATKLLPAINEKLELDTALAPWQISDGWQREVIAAEIPEAGSRMHWVNDMTWAPGDIVETYDEPLTWRNKSRS